MLFKTFKRNKRRLINVVMKYRFGRFKPEILSKLLPSEQSNACISEMIEAKTPFFAGRMGSGECDICWNFARARFLSTTHNRMKYQSASRDQGISNVGDPYLDRFASIYIASIPHVDLIALWEMRGVYALLHKFGAPTLRHTDLASLEPWTAYASGGRPWTSQLAGKKVLVVHPFARSIRTQYERRDAVKSIGTLLPSFELSTLVPPVTFAGQDNGKTWVSNLQTLMNGVAKETFDVAIIGCGAYGFPLGAFIKQMGRQAIHLGGSTQMLFGVRGKRWDEREDCASIMDETWIRPAEDERPAGADRVESGCYW
jgi:hypothetical protein